MTCVRTAWLVLGSLSVPLEDETNGYFCESLDLGYPKVREVLDDRPDQDGAVDRTTYMGPRTVTAQMHAIESAAANVQLDTVGELFAPFMVPSARPVLHYVLDRPGTPERTITLRPSNYSWPIAGAYERAVQLQFVAADPVVRDPNVDKATAWSGAAGGVGGRTYNLTFPRVYPVGGGVPIVATISGDGDVPIRPLLRIYGPITTPVVTFRRTSDNTVVGRVPFVAGYQITGGNFVEVDTQRHTAYLNGDRTQGVLSSLNWLAPLLWPMLPTITDTSTMALTGDPSGLVTSGVTQVQATWQDGYLS